MTSTDDRTAESSDSDGQLLGASAGAFPNWRGLECVPVDSLLAVAVDDGIPVAWVPPADVLMELLAVRGHEARLDVLSRFEDIVLSACEEELAGCGDESMSEDVALAGRVIEAFRAGHREAAACLALLGSEETFYDVTHVPRSPAGLDALSRYLKEELLENNPAAGDNWLSKAVRKWRTDRSSYAGLSRKARFQQPPPGWGDGLDPQAVFLPLKSLYMPYWPTKGDPVPVNLSRHFVAHRPVLEHLNKGHCLIAVMLMASFFALKQTYCTDAQMDYAEPDYGNDE
ncbi:hypothetical protein [Streptomyces acidiscabies]|uniref:Uncharacterized protein n=1 Tax=Streptomyces acidiscabies TaxID=42234 RepID=A0ABU4MDH1_9ACTN|nr:hypothetical protein [Streptomyces acidiscabies]MDX3026180.1 hypothetical protein [Streptomyces acidiscabies]